MKRGCKGQIRVLEVLLAAVIVFVFFTASSPLFMHRETRGSQVFLLKKEAYHALLALDEMGILNITLSVNPKNYGLLMNSLETVLPPFINFNLEVYELRTGKVLFKIVDGEKIYRLTEQEVLVGRVSNVEPEEINKAREHVTVKYLFMPVGRSTSSNLMLILKLTVSRKGR